MQNIPNQKGESILYYTVVGFDGKFYPINDKN